MLSYHEGPLRTSILQAASRLLVKRFVIRFPVVRWWMWRLAGGQIVEVQPAPEGNLGPGKAGFTINGIVIAKFGTPQLRAFD
jgi:hypothetical protein